jgi:hypothetical protein
MGRPGGQSPSRFGDALGVKGCTCDYLSCNCQCGHPDAVRFQVSAEHCRGRPQSRLAEGHGRKGRDRVIGEPAPGDHDGPEPSGRMAGAATCATTMALMTSTEYAAWRWATLEFSSRSGAPMTAL